MNKITKLDPSLARLLNNPTNNVRWSWADHSYYKISNYETYNQRFLLFSNFYNKFYSNRKYSLVPNEQYDIFEYPEYKLLIVGFNSCYCNDHLNRIGLIHPDCIINCYKFINKEKYEGWLKIAVWHHGIQAFPMRNDFMDVSEIQFLIDKGFQIGLHGHQHKSDIYEIKFSADILYNMIVLGCGTLSDYHKIPFGESRQYGVIEINDSLSSLRYHARKALEYDPNILIWMKGNIRGYYDRSFIDIPIKRFIHPLQYTINELETEHALNLLDSLVEIDKLIIAQEYIKALKILVNLDQMNLFVRKYTVECYFQLKMDNDIINYIKNPNNLSEFTYLVEALWRMKKFPDLERLLNGFRDNPIYANSEPFKRMDKKIKDRGN